MSDVGTRIHAALRGATTVNCWIVMAAIAAFAGAGKPANAQTSLLGTASSFAVLAGSTVTNTGSSDIQGDVGVDPGTAITGFPPGSITNGAIHAADAVAAQAQLDVTAAYNKIVSMATTVDLTGQNLGGLTLTPGVYHFASSAQLTGGLTLNAQGNSNALFIFQIGSTLTTASAPSINLINGADGCNVYFQVGSSATLGTTTAFTGSILADTSITLNTGASILDGSALAQNGAVTLDTNAITSPDCPGDTLVPESQSIVLFLGGGLPFLGLVLRRRTRR
jgi:type VI secretion system secreted protein VgrG